MIKAQDDVDILAFDKTGKKVLLCECKFRNKPMPMEEYDDLVMAAEMFKNAEEKYLMFFSKGKGGARKCGASYNRRLVLESFSDPL